MNPISILRAAATRPAVRALIALSALVALPPAAFAADQLDVSPSTARVAPGGAVHFVATLDGHAPDGPLEWRVIPPALGVVGPDGDFRAGPTSGRGIVRVSLRETDEVRVGHAIIYVTRAGAPARLRVSPESATLEPGEEIVFQAELIGDATLASPIEWSVSPSEAGTIEPGGRFRAAEFTGRAQVLARLTRDGDRIEGAARVWIGRRGGPPPRLTIVPAATTLRPGDRTQLEARLSPLPTDAFHPDVRWTLFPVELGVIDPSGMLIAGPQPGEGRAVASVEWEGHAIRAFARVRILPRPGNAALHVQPASALIAPGRSVQFEANLRGMDGPQPLDVTWSVDPANLGTITPSGLFTAYVADVFSGEATEGIVTAAAVHNGARLLARAHVKIAASGVPDLLDLKPRFITTRPGGEVQVTAYLGGRRLPSEVPLRWNVNPPILGIVTPDGLFIANENLQTPASDDFGRREGVLIATAFFPEGKTANGTARIEVIPEQLPNGIEIIPAQVTLPLDETVQFRITPLPGLTDAATPDRPRVSWHVQPQRLGSITPDGRFTPNRALGLATAANDDVDRVQGRVIAEVRLSTQQTVRATADVTVLLPDPGELQLLIEPRGAQVPFNETVQFRAHVTGGPDFGAPTVLTWAVEPATLGRISPDGLFTPNPARPDDVSGTRNGQVLAKVTLGALSRQAAARVTVRYPDGDRDVDGGRER